MIKNVTFASACAAMMLFVTSCNSNESSKATTPTEAAPKAVTIKTENVDYTGDGVTMKGFIAYNEADTNLKPAVLIVPEWWGIGDYTRGRAKQLAELGYVAFAIDMYGEGKTAETPDEAGSLATPFYAPTKLAQNRFDAALAKLKTVKGVDTTKIAAIGYCFGGAMVLNMARLGEPLKGVVSFHGNLVGSAPAVKGLIKADVLVCHGNADQFVPATEVATFKKQMDSIGASYTFKGYDSATHAFTNPMATEKGKKYGIPIAYNAAADTASFNEMKAFFEKIFK